MAEKILVADDSLTIQKVIAITLANTGYELYECLNEVELLKMLKEDQYDLVLLDFNLSDSKSGYELSKEIKTVSSSSQILAMLGTFDTVDDSELNDCGIGDKIVKPFESEKFILKCRTLIDSKGELTEVNLESSEIFEESLEESISEEVEIGSDWIVDSPKPTDVSSATLSQSDQLPEEVNFDGDVAKDALSEEIKGWGIEVPSVIGDETKFDLFPPKIEDASSLDEPHLSLTEEDLEHPDIGSSSESLESVTFDHAELVEENIEDDDEDLDATDPQFQMPANFSEELSSEVEEHIDSEDFWAVDDVDESPFEDDVNSFETATPEATSLDDLDDLAEEEVDQIFSDLESEIDSEKESYSIDQSAAALSSTPAAAVEFDSDELVAEVKLAITPVLEELVKKFCKEKIEQVAWEVIPDLAENLIRKEIKDIANSLES
ncbi:hypothetical protein A9Q84_19740 [Halobacteriovorax marinus]|uniref:Response regulatory domain-containing protein n=1 Tax=Halobacteriovorax marinus TaxID=97084 RepID=A0A1Y5F839_9BACT|nr:hypothetical protein A9Q84_19740 [Halobacteriovorax marinus]